MAEPKVFHGRIGAAYDTLEKWTKSTKVLVKGEIAVAVDTAGEYHIKVGDGTKTFANLEYATLSKTEIKEIIKALTEDHVNKIDTITVNGVNVAPDEKKNVEITIPAASTYEVGTVANETAGADVQFKKDGAVANTVTIVGDQNTTVSVDAGKVKISTPTYDDTGVKGRLDTAEQAITKLNGDETTDGSVKKITADAVASIVAGAPEDFDTLKELSDWISSHENDASAMNSSITDLKKVTALPEGSAQTTLVGYVDDAIKKADTSAKVAEDIAAAKQDAIDTAKSYSDGLAVNYATAAQGTKADSAIQSVKINGTVVEIAEDKSVNLALTMDDIAEGTNEFVIYGGDAGVTE